MAYKNLRAGYYACREDRSLHVCYVRLSNTLVSSTEQELKVPPPDPCFNTFFVAALEASGASNMHAVVLIAVLIAIYPVRSLKISLTLSISS